MMISAWPGWPARDGPIKITVTCNAATGKLQIRFPEKDLLWGISEFVFANPLYIYAHRFFASVCLLSASADRALVLLATWTSLSMHNAAVAFMMQFTAAHTV